MNPLESWPFRRVRGAAALGPVLLFLGIILWWLGPDDGGAWVAAAGALLALAGLALWVLTIAVVYRLTGGVESLQFAVRRLRASDPAEAGSLPDLPGLSGLIQTLRFMTEMLQRHARVEAHQRQVLEAVLNSIPSAILVVGPDGRVRLMNEPARRLSAPVGSSGAPAGAYLRDTRLLAAVDAALGDGASSVFELEMPDPHTREPRTLAAVVRPLREEAGEPPDAPHRGAGAVLALHDISEIRRLERARRDLIANVSHELKTPVAVIRGFAETLREGALERPEGPDFLQRIEAESDRIAAMVDRLLLLARLEQPDFEPVRRPVRLAALVGEIVEERRPLADRAGVTLTTAVDDGSLQVEADPELLRQAVGNLLDNAVRHTPAGGEVVVSVTEAAEAVRVEVADGGPGVAPEHRRRLFERFYRADPGRSRTAGGTGLGLAIVKHVAQVHGGRVGVDDGPAGGARFWLEVPRRGNLSRGS